MKRKLIFTALSFLLILSGFIYFKPSEVTHQINTNPSPPAPQSNSFLFGSMDSWQDEQDNYEDYDQLGLNFWHAYPRDDYSQIPGRNTPRTWLVDLQLLFKTKTANFKQQKIGLINLI